MQVAVVASHAGLPLPSEVYWDTMLPNTPMPKLIKDLLNNELSKNESVSVTGDENLDIFNILKYGDAGDEDQLRDSPIARLFFLEHDLHPGSIMNLQFVKSNTPGTLLPRKVSDSIPFSLKYMQEIYGKFSVIDPNSKEAEMIKKTIAQCEKSGIKGEEKYCATSLESMIDFIVSKLGKKILAISTETEMETDQLQQKYAIAGVKKVTDNDRAAICHKLNYAHIVFYCHKIENTEAFEVSLVGADGTKTKAAAVCHRDTSEWNPKQLAFQVLKVKPGSVPVCHFLTEDNIIWVPS